MRFSLVAVAVVLLLSSCNTFYQNGYEKILVRTPDTLNANCDLYTDSNRYFVLSGRQVVVERSKKPLTVICEKAGYYTASVIVKSKVHAPAAPMNVFNGFAPGMAWDVGTNSIYDYPETVVVTLLPLPPEKYEEPAPYILQKKPEPVKPAPIASAPPAVQADKAMSTSGKK